MPVEPPDLRGALPPFARPGVLLPPRLGRPRRAVEVVWVRAIVMLYDAPREFVGYAVSFRTARGGMDAFGIGCFGCCDFELV